MQNVRNLQKKCVTLYEKNALASKNICKWAKHGFAFYESEF